jgi:molybdenum cofactor sulfurtransferase
LIKIWLAQKSHLAFMFVPNLYQKHFFAVILEITKQKMSADQGEFYPSEVAKSLNKEFNDSTIYLDAAGAALPSRSAVLASAEELAAKVVANPHSSAQARDAITVMRNRVLDHFSTNADEYACVFVSGATAAARLVGEAILVQNGFYAYSVDSHTSLVGLRGLLANKENAQLLNSQELQGEKPIQPPPTGCNALASFPAMSNFDGRKYPLSAVALLQNVGYSVLLDAASLVATNKLSLAEKCSPNFVCISFYKVK